MLAIIQKRLPLISKIDLFIGFFLFFLILATSWSLFRPAFFRVHDYVHGARIAELVRSAQAGHLPVRWTDNFGYGYGMPLFEFYAPLPYYIGGLSYWLTGNLVLSSKALFLIANIGSVVGSYLLGKELYGKKGGVVVAAAYSLAPYRAVNLFVRGAVGESWGMMMMPFALWAGLRVITNAKRGQITTFDWWMLVLSLVGLFLSHNLSTLMYLPVSVVILTFVAWQKWGSDLKEMASGLFSIVSSYLIAIGLAAFYLFPALLEKDFTIISNILSGYFNYIHHFLYIRQFMQPNWGYGGSAWGPDDGISFFLGYGQILGVFVSCMAIAWFLFGLFQRKRSVLQLRKTITSKVLKTRHFQLFILFGVTTLGALYATLLKSQWWWDTLPLISFIQFPWRWLSIAILFTALLAGYGVILIQSKRVMSIIIIGLIVALGLNIQYFQPESYLDRNEDFYYEDPQLIRTEMSGILPDYIPKDLRLIKLEPTDSEAGEKDETIDLLPVNLTGKAVFNDDDFVEISLLADRPHQKLVSVESEIEQEVMFAVAWFPGWKAEIDGASTDLIKTNNGLIAVTVPAGKSQVGVYFGSTPVRFWSDAVSMLSIGVIVWLLLPSTLFTTRTKTTNKTKKLNKNVN